MRMTRHASALILSGGWLLLSNPEAHRPNAPLARWEKVGEYDTAYLCEQARSKSVSDLVHEQRKDPKAPRLAPGDAQLRYRCDRVEHYESLKPR